MTGSDFRTRLDALGIRPGALARRIGRRPEAVSRWFREGPEPYAEALVDALEGLPPDRLAAWRDVASPGSRIPQRQHAQKSNRRARDPQKP